MKWWHEGVIKWRQENLDTYQVDGDNEIVLVVFSLLLLVAGLVCGCCSSGCHFGRCLLDRLALLGDGRLLRTFIVALFGVDVLRTVGGRLYFLRMAAICRLVSCLKIYEQTL